MNKRYKRTKASIDKPITPPIAPHTNPHTYPHTYAHTQTYQLPYRVYRVNKRYKRMKASIDIDKPVACISIEKQLIHEVYIDKLFMKSIYQEKGILD